MTDRDGRFRDIPADVHAEGEGRIHAVHGDADDGHVGDLLGAHLQGGRTIPSVLQQKAIETTGGQDLRLKEGMLNDVVQRLPVIVI
jgi:hypothetical protein